MGDTVKMLDSYSISETMKLERAMLLQRTLPRVEDIILVFDPCMPTRILGS